MGCVGWGVVCHVREFEGGERVARGRRMCEGMGGCGGVILRESAADASPRKWRWAFVCALVGCVDSEICGIQQSHSNRSGILRNVIR